MSIIPLGVLIVTSLCVFTSNKGQLETAEIEN